MDGPSTARPGTSSTGVAPPALSSSGDHTARIYIQSYASCPPRTLLPSSSLTFTSFINHQFNIRGQSENMWWSVLGLICARLCLCFMLSISVVTSFVFRVVRFSYYDISIKLRSWPSEHVFSRFSYVLWLRLRPPPPQHIFPSRSFLPRLCRIPPRTLSFVVSKIFRNLCLGFQISFC